MDDVEERGEPVALVQLARKRRGQVEAEAVDVHLQRPVPQAVHDQLQHARMHHVERVAGAGEIHVLARIVGHQPVVRRVVDPAKRERRPEPPALGGVVVNDVENDFDPRRVQRLHHGLELGQPAIAAGVARFGREVADGVVPPVIDETLLHQLMVVDEGVHRHQLDRRHPETAQMVQHGRSRQRGVLAAQALRHVGMQRRESLDVQLVDQRVVPRRRRAAILTPGERRIDDLALGHAEGVVALVHGEIFALAADAIAEMTVAPAQIADDRFGVWIEQQLLRVEAKPFRRIVGTVNPVAVAQSGPGVGQIAMPDLIGLLGQLDALDLAPALGIEHAQLHALGLLREEREVDALAVPCRAQRVRAAGPGHEAHRTDLV